MRIFRTIQISIKTTQNMSRSTNRSIKKVNRRERLDANFQLNSIFYRTWQSVSSGRSIREERNERRVASRREGRNDARHTHDRRNDSVERRPLVVPEAASSFSPSLREKSPPSIVRHYLPLFRRCRSATERSRGVASAEKQPAMAIRATGPRTY